MAESVQKKTVSVKKIKKKKRSKNKIKILALIYVVGVLAVWAVFFAFYSAFIALSLFIPRFELPTDYTVILSLSDGGDKKVQSRYSVAKKDALIDGEIYVNFSDIADACGFSVSGDGTRLRYKISETNGVAEYMTVFLEKGYLLINGNPINLKNGVKLINDELYLPVFAVNEYISGIDISFDEEEKDVNILIESEIHLKLHYTEALEKIDVSEI